MNSFAARQLKIAGVCLVLTLLNWHVETNFFRPADGRLVGLHIEYGPIVVALVISAGLAVWWLCSVWSNLRVASRAHVYIEKGPKWGDCVALLYLIPLLFRFDYHSSWTDQYGRSAETVYFFGHMPLSMVLIFLALGGVFLFQMRARLIDAIPTEFRRRVAQNEKE
jgi:hypothetical protein